ncbi:polyketide synthase dehydratase domain-containing protein, partial [Actinosynnema sp. NPDC023658]|uniref:polyketide synthase dehydratase domain-containing protein n=1 Tax=Actinosynnema sp. NPDC023658 TaxID=3155465 RepID=UPI00340A1684
HWHPTTTTLDLPTYPFQHHHYWLHDTGAGDLDAAGLHNADHPLLGATTTLADNDTVLYTGRLSTRTHPWLADHTVAGTTLLPGTAFIELALHAGREADCGRLDDLTLETPLVLGSTDIHVQVTVAAPDDSGSRAIGVYSRDDSTTTWTRHATGTLGRSVLPPQDTTRLPEDARPLDVSSIYDGLADTGLEYGPTFQGLRAAWQHDDDLYADIALPDDTDTTGYDIHPALLDAALHTLALNAEDRHVKLPFAWSGVQLHATGAERLRVRITPTGNESVSLFAVDGSGQPVITIDSLTLRPLDVAPTAPVLHQLTWSPIPTPASVSTPDFEVFRVPDENPVQATLTHLQHWLTTDNPR